MKSSAFGEQGEGVEILRFQEDEPTVVRVGSGIRKRARHWHPDDPRPIPKTAWALFNECAALDFLDRLHLDPPVSPRLIEADIKEGVLVMEDLGQGPSLAELLNGEDEDAARKACVLYARTLGRMHTATLGREADYNAFRDSLGPGGRHALYQNYAEQIELFQLACESAGIDWQQGEGDLQEILFEMEYPGQFNGLLHGDVGPGNEKVFEDRVVLFDFEVAGFGHVMREAAVGRFLFAEGDNSGALPLNAVLEMEKAHRDELKVSDEAWARAFTLAAAFHVIAEVGWDLSQLQVTPHVHHRCTAFLDLVRESGHLESLGRVVRQLAAALPPVEPMQLYPVFQKLRRQSPTRSSRGIGASLDDLPS